MSGKKKIAIIISFVVIIIAALFFYNDQKIKKELAKYDEMPLIPDIKEEPLDNYKIKETPDGKIVINENIGLVLSVPDGWSVEIAEDVMGVKLSSPDFTLDERGIFPLSGCSIDMGVTHYIKSYPEQFIYPYIVQDKIRGEREIIDREEIIEIDGRPTLKIRTFADYGNTQLIMTETPIANNALYGIGIVYANNDEKRCQKAFSNFLDTIKIN